MAQRNSENDGLVFAAVAFLFMFVFLYAIACFIAVVLTIIAYFAWHTPVTILKWTITPREARIFICSGIAGMVGTLLFAVFSAAMFHIDIKENWWGYIMLGGYSLGALGIGAAIGRAEEAEAAAMLLAGPPTLPASRSDNTPPQTKPPFRFGSWDDEDAR